MANSKCIASQWSIAVDPKAHAFMYDVTISFGRPDTGNDNRASRTKILTKSGNYKKLCRHVFMTLGVFDDLAFAYDGQAILWTSKALKHDVHVTKSHAELDAEIQEFLKDREGVLHVAVVKSKTIKLSDYGQKADGNAAEDRTWRNVMELILTEDAVTRSNNGFIPVGAGELFEARAIPFDRGLMVREGNRKGVHVVKGQKGPQLCVSLDSTKKVFFPDGANFLDLVKNFMAGGRDYDEAEAIFRGIKLAPVYNPGRIMNFKKFTDRPVANLTTDTNQPLEAYFAGIGQRLQHIRERAATMSNAKGEFPLEVLHVLPHQPVPVVRMSTNLKERTLELNRLKPHDRLRLIKSQFEKLNFNNNITAAFGIRVSPNMIEGSYERLPRMNVVIRNNNAVATIQPNDFGSFKFERGAYYKPARFDFFVVLSTRRDNINSMLCADAIVQAAAVKGMSLPSPIFKEFNTSSKILADWVKVLAPYKGKKAVVLTVDSDDNSHDILKLAEVLTGVQTQHMYCATARNVPRRSQTLENIVHKMNIKAGGLNHMVDFGNNLQKINMKTTLIVSVDVAHPTGDDYRGSTDEPSVVGLVGNYLENPMEFAGLHDFQPPRQELVDPTTLRTRVKQMLQAASRHRNINTIVFLRDGVSEGQYPEVLNDELPSLKSAASDLNLKCSVVGIIVTKNGNARHFSHGRSGPESMPPRSFVSFGSRYNFVQFYMTAHRAFAGTAKSVMITVIRDDLQIGARELQTFLLGLTNLHQIVAAPISLPAPIYQADALAERGQKLFRAFKKYQEARIPRDNNNSIDYTKLSNILNFNNGNLPLTRYTA